MTTAEPLTQTSKTVPVQDMQFFSLGQPTDTSGPLAVVLGLGNVVAAFCIAGSSPAQDLRAIHRVGDPRAARWPDGAGGVPFRRSGRSAGGQLTALGQVWCWVPSWP